MTIVADISVGTEGFAFGEALPVPEDTRLRLTQALRENGRIVAYLWATADHGFPATVRGNDSVADLEAVDERNGRTLYRLTWTPDDDGDLIETVMRTETVVEGATATATEWSFRLWVPGYGELERVRTACQARNIALSVDRLLTVAEGREPAATGLTDKQREALALAGGMGYFAVPRETTIAALADRLGISESATAQRLRRGVHSLLVDAGLGGAQG